MRTRPNTAAVNNPVRADPSPSCSWKPSRFSLRRLMFGRARRLRARSQYAVDQPGDPASVEDREPRAEPNDNRDDRYGPLWQTVHGAMSPRRTDIWNIEWDDHRERGESRRVVPSCRHLSAGKRRGCGSLTMFR